ncbi:WecB/TagA/CpsF family glycosyltransferase [Belliella marina]|uniref:WecB/TagA/CpsF family glycosyltransferase n=1 Tax=Belliella marina TaxID=1644146 RepID=A0ABW4VL77_9BACT
MEINQRSRTLTESPFPQVNLLGVNVHQVNQDSLLDYFQKSLQDQNSISLINYVNAHGLTLAQKNRLYKERINASTVLFCDGFGVRIAGKLLGKSIGDRMTPPDWFEDLIQLITKEKKRVFFLGDEAEVIEKFAIEIGKQHPGLSISGYYHGFFDKSGPENDRLVSMINNSQTDIVITGMGMPIQETWAYDNHPKLNVSTVFATGALFRHYLGIDKRGPKFVTDNGGEWLMRLIFQPKKLWKRYLIGLPNFFYLVLKEKYAK